MKLRNEFTVAAPLERTWATLLDVPRVAAALPGAAIEPGGANGDYRGRMKVKIGPVTAHTTTTENAMTNAQAEPVQPMASSDTRSMEP